MEEMFSFFILVSGIILTVPTLQRILDLDLSYEESQVYTSGQT